MKKIILFLSFILSASIVFAQYPITQYLGSDSALVKARSALSTGAGLINGFYKDTTSANLTHISQYPHAQIIVGDVLYIRDSTATRWISSHNGGSGIDSAAYHTTTQINDTTIKQTKPNGDGTVWQFIGGSSGSSGVKGVTPGSGISVDSTDPAHPIVSAAGNPVYQWSVLDSLSTPPASPLQGDIYLVGTSPTGAFSGQANNIATYDTTAGYSFQVPATGDLLYSAKTYYVSKWNGTTWIRQPQPLTENWWTRTAWNGARGQFIQTGAQNSYATMFGSLNNNSVGLGRQVFTDDPLGGNNNIAIGGVSQYHNQNGYNNISLGTYSLWYGAYGHDQIAIGTLAAQTGNQVFSIGLGTNVQNVNKTFSISDSTTHMHLKLDSASGTAPNVIGKDANGNWHVYTAPAGGGGTYTASNGLTKTDDDIQLGGTLSSSTVIDAGNYGLSITGSTATQFSNIMSLLDNGQGNTLNVEQQSTGNALRVGATTGNAIYAFNVDGTVNNVSTGLYIARVSTTPSESGVGTKIVFELPTDRSGTPIVPSAISNEIKSVLTNTDANNPKSQLIISGISGDILTLSDSSGVKFNQYGSGTFTGTPAKQLSVTSTGDIIETDQPIITSGTSSPSSTPAKVGDIYVDITAKKLYFATGTSSSSDWTIAN